MVGEGVRDCIDNFIAHLGALLTARVHAIILTFQFLLRQESGTGVFKGQLLREVGDIWFAIHG